MLLAPPAPARADACLDVIFIPNKEEPVGDVLINGSLGCIDHEIVESKILRGMRKEGSRVQSLDFRRTGFSLFMDLVGGILWEAPLKGKGIRERCETSTGRFLQAQEWFSPDTQANKLDFSEDLCD